MMPYTDYMVRLGDLKRAIMENPYDPNLDIDGYMRYLKYNTPSAQPEIVRCKDCKHRDSENGFCEGRGWPMQLVHDNGFCDKGERSEE